MKARGKTMRARGEAARGGALRAGLALLVVAALAASGCGAGSSQSTSAVDTPSPSNTKSIEVVLDWVPNPDHLALYTALTKGYFRAHGLNVTLQSPSNVTEVGDLVATGHAPLGISYEPDTIIAGAAGLPVTAVGALVPVALNSIIAPARSGITTPAQLEGKSVGITGIPSDYAFLKAIARHAGIPLNAVHQVIVGSSLLPAVVSGKVDAILGGYRNVEAVQVRNFQLHPWVLPITEAGVPPYDELVIIANRDRLRDDAGYRNMVREFLAALAQGNATAVARPSEALAAMAPVVKGYASDVLRQMVAVTAPLLANPLGFGQMKAGAWQSFADWMHSTGLIDKPVQAADVMTDAYLPGG